MIIEIEGYKFDIDKEKTEKFYNEKSITFNSNKKFENLEKLLKRFFVDIRKPEKQSKSELYFKIIGKVLEFDKHEIDVFGENFFCNIMVSDDEDNDFIYFDIFGNFD